MQRHAFGFGNVVNSQLLGGKEDSFPYTQKRVGTSKTSTWRDAEKYREIVREYFNWVTFESELRPHKWKEMAAETRRGRNARRLLTQQAVPWLQSHGIGIRGHYIAWGAIDFTEIEKAFVGNPEGHRKWLWDHMADILPGTADYVSEWDTINHIIGWGKHTYEIEYGGYDIYAEIMKEARRLAPNAGHTVNEGKVLPNGYKRDSYKRVIRFLNDRKQTPDTVGFMAHFELTSLTPPEELLSVYDDFGEIAPQLQLSEFDVETGDDEQLQADFYRDVMIATFSHPKFVSIVQWGFWENAHWKPAAALWRTDWTLKPSGRVFVDLVKKQWWTNEISETDTNGQCQLRGFLGDYRITVEHNEGMIEREFKLEKGESHVRIGIQ
jgi:GH35 family endo-1,4-beta-xylanase